VTGRRGEAQQKGAVEDCNGKKKKVVGISSVRKSFKPKSENIS
jgi:hypothetical protein